MSQVLDKQEYELDQEDLEEVMKKYDRESNVRIWTGRPAWIVKAILIGFSLFCIRPTRMITKPITFPGMTFSE